MRIYSLLLICGLSVMPVAAQGAADIVAADKKMVRAVALMQKGDWEKAHKVLANVEAQYESVEKGVKVFGVRFGSLYYNKGLCELKMAQDLRKQGAMDDPAKVLFNGAITSLQKCYSIKNTDKDSGNIYRVKSLLLIGNAQQGLGQFKEAILTYEKFLFEKDDIWDRFNLGDLSTNLAICYWSKEEPDFEKAEAVFLRGLKLRRSKAPSTFSMITGMRAMLTAAEKAGQGVRVENFIQEHHELIKVKLVDAVEYLPRFSQLIIKSANMGWVEASNVLASKIPDSESLLYLEKNLPIAKKFPDEPIEVAGENISLAEATAIVEQKEAIGKAIVEAEEFALAAQAVGNERMGKYRQTAVVYELLLLTYPETKHKADYLYNLSRVLLLSDDVDRAYEFGSKYLTDYPDHQFSLELKRSLLLSLYAKQRYGLCIKLNEEGLLNMDQLKGDAKLVGDCVFALGAAYFYEGKFESALPLIERQFVNYPESEFRNEVCYLHASVYGHVLQWEEGLKLLDEYIASVDDENVYKPHALYDKAFVLYSMGRYDEAIVLLKTFIGKYNKSLTKAPAHILSGNIYLLKKLRDDAETEYQRAITSAKYTNNKHAEDEAYYLMITMLGQKLWEGRLNEKTLDSVKYFDAYMAGEPMKDRVSPFYTQIVANAMYALTQSGRKDEAFKLMQKALFEYNTEPNTAGTEGAMQGYVITLRNANVKDDEVIDGLKTSPFVTDSSYHQALLVVSELDVLERSQRMAPSEERGKRIKALYADLHFNYKIEDLDNFVLIKVAKHLEKNNGFSDKAKSYYEGVIASGSKIKLPEAQVGLLTLLAKSDDPAEVKLAEDSINGILANPFTAVNAKAAAHYQLLELLYAQENWEDLTKNAITYLKYPTSAKKKVRRAEMLLAMSYDKREMTERAIGSYTAVWVNSMFVLDQSAPAMHRVITLLWERNNPAKPGVQDGKSDRQIAYESAFKYVSRTKKIFNEKGQTLNAEAEQDWRSIREKVDKYGAEPGVKKFHRNP